MLISVANMAQFDSAIGRRQRLRSRAPRERYLSVSLLRLISLSPELVGFNCVLGENGCVVEIVLNTMLAEHGTEKFLPHANVYNADVSRASSSLVLVKMDIWIWRSPSGRLGQQP